MDLIKQYIIQSISAASNNLRLSTQKIEVVALLRESISRSVNLENDIREMKKITELSKFAIRLNEIYNFLTQPHVDFFRISDKFKEHSQYLIKDLSSLLEIVNPQSFKIALSKMNPSSHSEPLVNENLNTINIDLSKRKMDIEAFEKTESEEIKEKIILDEEKDEDEIFHDYEALVMKPIKPLDAFLQKIDASDYDKNMLAEFRDIISGNGEISQRQGFNMIAEMHEIISRSLDLIYSGILLPERQIIESIRACLIVIVAVVKGKEIDITNYLNRAEEFGREIQKIN